VESSGPNRIERTEVVDTPYASNRTEHQRIADIADPMAQAIMAELESNGVQKERMKFSVYLQLRDSNSSSTIPIEAIRYDPLYDYEAHVKRAATFGPPGSYARFNEGPGDAAFRIHGKSRGMFLGGWIAFGYKQKHRGLYPGEEPSPTLILHAITVTGWEASLE
jgi:hypothetical protein